MVEGAAKDKSKNTMRDLHIRKLCLNICAGEMGWQDAGISDPEPYVF
jgi:hypothetical protein